MSAQHVSGEHRRVHFRASRTCPQEAAPRVLEGIDGPQSTTTRTNAAFNEQEARAAGVPGHLRDQCAFALRRSIIYVRQRGGRFIRSRIGRLKETNVLAVRHSSARQIFTMAPGRQGSSAVT